MVLAPGLRIPRISMHRCRALTTTATPLGLTWVMIASAISVVMRSLDLEPPAEDLHDPRQLADADYPLVFRYVRDVAHAEKGKEVVLAHGVEMDVLDDNHLVVLELVGVPEYGCGVGLLNVEDILEHARNPVGSVFQSGTRRVFPDRLENVDDCFPDLLPVHEDPPDLCHRGVMRPRSLLSSVIIPVHLFFNKKMADPATFYTLSVKMC